MRYLGIDYGGKRVGISVSDESNSFAFPLKVLENTEKLISDIIALCEENDVGVVVVGESKNYQQEENQIMKEITPFVERLKKESNLEVNMFPEFLTSQEAERLQGKNEMHDASAAALILKHFLETKKQ